MRTAAILSDKRVRWSAAIVAGIIAALLMLLAAFPWGMLKGMIEDRLSRRFGRTVTIGRVERIDGFGFHPMLRVTDIRIPQARWAGEGDLARIADARIGFLALPLLRGRFKVRELSVERATLTLVRAKDGRVNWGESSDRKGPGGRPLDSLVIRGTTVLYRDAKQGRSFRVMLASDTKQGFRIAGSGDVRGAPVIIEATGPAIAGGADGRWPFTAKIDGAALAMTAKGTMAHPLDTDSMTLDVTARASDLKLIDAIIEAGLFRTQPVGLSAHVERDGETWTIPRLEGTVGRSRFAGKLKVEKVDGRTKLAGDFDAGVLDFDDLSSDEGIAQGEAKERAIGPRLVPDTRINLAKIGRTDGRFTFRVRRVVQRQGESPITAMQGTLVLDHQRLTIDPLGIAMRQGAITGRAVVDQDGRKEPKLALDLRLSGSSIGALAGGGGSVTGRVDARAVLTGRGSTIREAIGRADGRIGLAARDGQLPARIASALGFDAGRALTAGDDDRAGLRCVILGLPMRSGRGTVSPLILDTTQSQSRGTGTISFPDERLAITLTGAPKHNSILRLPGSATMAGTIRLPDIIVPKQVKSVGNFFKAIGRAITGKQGPTATDADCGALAAQVLR
ncbi:AsmA family protein [Sphingomonas sp. EC-HK361]|uniref:AsmA family protein n=1 Tax=Sphingomonas sp. EC-HK361 TaxID=2038397 RepID=UPI00125C38FC|nr:AsmA family protein [Sphingomonas sp. EC-HK361]VVS96017.1 AsmA family protein [Sphingomonas sp. EC-HK361]